MKKAILVLTAAMALASNAWAQAGKFAVNADPLMLLFCDIRGGVEYAVTDNISVKADIDYSPNWFWVTDMSILDLSVRGRYYLGNLVSDKLPEQFREYVAGPALRGLYAGAGGGFASLRYDWGSVVGTYFAPEIMFELGTKYELTKFGLKNFFAEPAMGAKIPLGDSWTWKDADGKETTGTTTPSYGGFYYSFGIGYFF